MKKIIKKIIGAFTIIGTYLIELANKVYASDEMYLRVAPAYGIKEPIRKSSIILNGFFLILLPIAAIITIIIGIRKYIKKSRDRKAVRILIIEIIAIVILIRVLILGINNILYDFL